MAAEENLDALEAAVRRALAADRFDQAGSALKGYIAAVGRQARSAESRPSEARELERGAHALLDFAAMMARTARESAGAELSRLESLRNYGSQERPGAIRAEG